MTWPNKSHIVYVIDNDYIWLMNKLTGEDTYRPESYEEFKEIARMFMVKGIEVYEELPIITEDRYNDFPILSWNDDNYEEATPHLTACKITLSNNIINTRGQFLHKAGIKKEFNGGKHLIHEFI